MKFHGSFSLVLLLVVLVLLVAEQLDFSPRPSLSFPRGTIRSVGWVYSPTALGQQKNAVGEYTHLTSMASSSSLDKEAGQPTLCITKITSVIKRIFSSTLPSIQDLRPALQLAGQAEAHSDLPLPLLLDEDEGPVVVNSRQSVSTFNMKMPTGSFDYHQTYEYDTTNQSGSTVGSTSNTFQESLTLSTDAYFLSPNLLDLKLGVTGGLEQDLYDAAGVHESTNGFLDGWDVTGIALRNEDMPITLYTHRTEQTLTPDFSPALQSTDTTYGASVIWRSPSTPTTLDFHYSDDTQVEDDNQLDSTDTSDNYSLTQDVFHWHTDVVSLHNQTLTWDCDYDNSDEQESGTTPVHILTEDANLTHNITFGAANADALNSSFSATNQTGDLAYQHYRFDENLHIQNTPDLLTHYDYTFDNSTSSGVTQTLNSIDVGLAHHLFKSLVTTADVGGSLLDVSGNGESPQLFGRVDWSYRKKVPYGLLVSDLNLGWQWQQFPSGTQPLPVINQPFAFSNGQPIALTQPYINPQSIVVLNPSGIPYLNGRDYVVNSSGNLVQIERVLGGLIPPNGSILLDYDLLPEPANTTNTGDAGLSTRYEISQGPLSGLAPYARISFQRQSISAAAGEDSTLIPDSFNDAVLGADYRIGPAVFNAEQEWDDSTLLPFIASRFSARYSAHLSDKTSASVAANENIYNYYSTGDNVTDTSVTGSIDKAVTREFIVSGRVVWLDDEDELFGPTRGLEEQLEMKWTHNQTEIDFRLSNSSLSTDAENDTYQTIEFEFKRHF